MEHLFSTSFVPLCVKTIVVERNGEDILNLEEGVSCERITGTTKTEVAVTSNDDEDWNNFFCSFVDFVDGVGCVVGR
jgi:ribosome-associated toxin RatA of RatAB toxin-antitoxin module